MKSVIVTMSLISISLLLILSGGRHMFVAAEGTDHFYPCFTMVNCDDSVDASYTEAKEVCMQELVLKEDVPKIVDMVNENGILDLNTYVIEELFGIYCPIEPEQQEDAFNQGGAGVLDMVSKMCSNPMQVAECTRFNAALDCYTKLVDQMHDDEVC